MEPTDKAVIRLPQYTGRNGVGPPYAEWLMRLQTVIREKDLQNAIKFVEQGENIIRPIPQNSTVAITKEAYTKDRQLSAILLNAITLDAFEYAQIKFPISEQTKDEDFIGLRLYMGLKVKYDVPLIRSEIYRIKQEILTISCNGNISAYLAKVTKSRFEFLAHVKFADGQITLLDEDIIQSILAKLPANFNQFVSSMRQIELYAMTVSTLVEKIEIEERAMKQQHYRPHQHAQSQEANAIKMAGKWKGKEKKGKE